MQRLIQRTSSIPNIGRKALKQQEELEPKAKPLLNIRAKLQRPPGSHLASPFLLSTHEPRDPESPQRSSDPDIPNLSPKAHKLGPVLQGDMMDMNVLQQYYQSYIDSGSPAERNDDNYADKTNNYHPTHASRLHKLNHRHYPFRQNGLSKRSYTNSPVTQYNSIVNGAGKVIALSDLPDIMPRTTYTYYSTTDSSYGNGDPADYDKIGRFPELQTSYRYQLGQSDASSTTSGVSKSWLRSVQRRKHNNSPVEEALPETVSMQDGKMKIVVDMPNIIFNAASPEGDVGSDNGQSSNMQPENVLRKAMKQQEIRKKELHNLLEDVKELNMMSEVLNGSSVAHGT